MSIPSQDYAALSDDAYQDRAVGRRAPGQQEPVTLNGHQYKVLEHVNNPRNGYQGTVYQRVDTKEIVVSHRGTEQIMLDAVITDGVMVTGRTNLQAKDAIALTERAMEYASKQGAREGHTPPVTVTGHSLGGTLAQISAHHFDLKGETFNAFGAVSMNRRIPEGGDTMVNHVMAADPVSAASPHYGQVRIYASAQEIKTLEASGFSNSRYNALIPDRPVIAAAASLGSHKLGNFLDSGSVLGSEQAKTLANTNARMINEYRDDIGERRSTATVISRGTVGGAVDLIDNLRGTLPAGEPARREAGTHAGESEKDKDVSLRPKDAGHISSLRIDQAGHAGHPLFNDAQRGVYAQDTRVGRTPDQSSDQLAGSLAAQMHAAGGKRIDHVLMSNDASNTFAVQGKIDDPAHLRVTVGTMLAMNTPLEQSSRKVEEQATNQHQEQDRNQEQVQSSGRTMMG
ncbi:XVIPCD domain-containing protein [Stenotrophomonas sp. TWI700]|uniref:XVIPCD domain-containing protein n=1 Tax=Stenotrophomonas sp. TWI700 TaxID=3136792 RepID=UPI00320AF17F